MGLAREPPLHLFRNQLGLHFGQQRPPLREGQAQLGKTAVAALNHGQNSVAVIPTVSLSPSDNLASMINRMVCSHRCGTDQRTPHEAGAAPRCSSGPPWEPPQVLHALGWQWAM